MSLTELIAWVVEHDVVIWWVMAGSAALTLGTLAALPWLVCQIPDDYFATKERLPVAEYSPHPVLHWIFRIARNLLGIILLLLGLVMLVGPGQGLMAILAGLLLTEFPGKRRLEMWMIRRPGLLKGITWLRVRRVRPPLNIWTPEKKRLPPPPRNNPDRTPIRH